MLALLKHQDCSREMCNCRREHASRCVNLIICQQKKSFAFGGKSRESFFCQKEKKGACSGPVLWQKNNPKRFYARLEANTVLLIWPASKLLRQAELSPHQGPDGSNPFLPPLILSLYSPPFLWKLVFCLKDDQILLIKHYFLRTFFKQGRVIDWRDQVCRHREHMAVKRAWRIRGKKVCMLVWCMKCVGRGLEFAPTFTFNGPWICA